MLNIGVVGAGFSGAVIARELALGGARVTVFDARTHLAGNCHTERDRDTNIMVHVYGPHIFHTSDELVWSYVRQFDEFVPFTNRVKAVVNNKIYSLPINLMTINTFFGKSFSPKDAEHFISSIGDKSVSNPETFEEQALRFLGVELYEAFFKGYTEKQWGIHPRQLPASILKRLPIRFNYDDNYYSSKYQAIPKNGYTSIIEKMLDVSNVEVRLNTRFSRSMAMNFDHIFYSGPIDSWFDHISGRLGYRTLDFDVEYHDGDYQGNPVINYCDGDIPYTRISEHKHFAPWETHRRTIIYKEYSRQCGKNDIPYYPIRLVNDKLALSKYIEMAQSEENVTFIGRLGTYRYLDMHVVIGEALASARAFMDDQSNQRKIPSFYCNPI